MEDERDTESAKPLEEEMDDPAVHAADLGVWVDDGDGEDDDGPAAAGAVGGKP